MIFSDFAHRIFLSHSQDEFQHLALEAFDYQRSANTVYNNYLNALRIAPDKKFSFDQIPFLPIEFFKSHEVKSGNFTEKIIFTSSGTSGMTVSRHFIKDPELYRESFLQGFKLFYGEPSSYTILGLLPSYLERQGSSLIFMVDELIKLSQDTSSGFFLNDYEEILHRISINQRNSRKTILFGVTFALLDFASSHAASLEDTIIIETGGMKGRGEELTRQEVHERLRNSFPKAEIHSEYGMTELLSQAYSSSKGIFYPPPWMKVVVRDPSDPLSWKIHGDGALNIIDLSNIHSCSFIATQDVGKVHADGSFEVSGRFDHADVRGCNLLVL